MYCHRQTRIQLQQGFAAGEDNKWTPLCIAPLFGYLFGKFLSVGKLASARAIDANEVGVTEFAIGCLPMFLASGP
jgi:hypothetical protein